MFCIHILCHLHILHSHCLCHSHTFCIMHIFCSHLYVILIFSANITSHIYSCGTSSHLYCSWKIKFSIHFSPFIITYSYFLFSFIVLQFSRSNPVPLEFFFSFSSFILWFNRLLALTSSSLYFLTDRFATKYVPIPTTKQTDLKCKYMFIWNIMLSRKYWKTLNLMELKYHFLTVISPQTTVVLV